MLFQEPLEAPNPNELGVSGDSPRLRGRRDQAGLGPSSNSTGTDDSFHAFLPHKVEWARKDYKEEARLKKPSHQLTVQKTQDILCCQ